MPSVDAPMIVFVAHLDSDASARIVAAAGHVLFDDYRSAAFDSAIRSRQDRFEV
jgi:hypothetical protein